MHSRDWSGPKPPTLTCLLEPACTSWAGGQDSKMALTLSDLTGSYTVPSADRNLTGSWCLNKHVTSLSSIKSYADTELTPRKSCLVVGGGDEELRRDISDLSL